MSASIVICLRPQSRVVVDLLSITSGVHTARDACHLLGVVSNKCRPLMIKNQQQLVNNITSNIHIGTMPDMFNVITCGHVTVN